MPFTPAHAIVALPFVRSRRWSPAAVAAGAVAPDLPLFVSDGAGYEQTHSLWAVPTLDLGIGLVLLALWWALVRPGLVAVLPSGIRSRIPARRPPRRALLPVAVAVGALSHVAWDAFTHRHRLGEQLVPALGDRFGGLSITSWLQDASGAIGLAVLAVAALRAYARTPPDPAHSASALRAAARPAAIIAAVVPIGAATVAAGSALGSPGGPSASGAAYAAGTALLLWAAAVLVVIGAAVRIRGRPGGRTTAVDVA